MKPLNNQYFLANIVFLVACLVQVGKADSSGDLLSAPPEINVIAGLEQKSASIRVFFE